jgi:hypothetical protein
MHHVVLLMMTVETPTHFCDNVGPEFPKDVPTKLDHTSGTLES